jgi:hypothetical protein
MGHHHRRNRNQESPNPDLSQNTNNNNNPLGNMDISSMLGNLNLNNIDLSKVDMSKVQSMMNKMSVPQSTPESPSGSPDIGIDPSMNFLNSLRAIMPAKRSKSMDSITKFFKIAQLLNSARGINPLISKRK